MKISLNWLKTLMPLGQKPEEIEALLTGSGLEVEHFETLESIKGGLKGLIVGEVKACEKHPNADKLNLTKVDIGQADLLDIVCGAPNVAAGQKVIVAPVGTMLYPTEGEAFKIQKAKIRGEASNGMLCAEDEIGMGKGHDGILILPETAVVGQALTDIYPVETDVLFEIGLTANRGDATSHVGVARELSTLLEIPFQFQNKDIEFSKKDKIVQIKIESPEECPRYCGVVLGNIVVKESPKWMKDRLKTIGIKSINNIVDVTNYVLHETGQPLHAFDLESIKGKEIIVKKAEQGTSFFTLDGNEHQLKGHELMINDIEKPLCIAGVYGGLHSGVTEKTQSIFLESAYFSPDIVRKSAKSLGISTDSSFRFERGTDPEMCIPAIQLAIYLIKETCDVSIDSELTDVYPNKLEAFSIDLSIQQVEKVLGIQVPVDRIKQILEGLGIQIKDQTSDVWKIEVPRFKSDVTRAIDVIEEIIRIYGFQYIPLQKHLKMSLNYQSEAGLRDVERSISELLRGVGYREIMTNSLSSDQYESNKEELIYLSNPLSSEMNVLRSQMLHTALESIAYNKNRKQNNTRFFEFGKTYKQKEKGFKEKNQLIIIASGNQADESWEQKSSNSNWFDIQTLVNKIHDKYRISKHQVKVESVDKKTLQMHGIKDEVYYAVMDWTALPKQSAPFELKPIPLFPGVRRDLSLIVEKQVQYSEIQAIIEKYGSKMIVSTHVFDVYMGKPLESNQKSISIGFELYNKEKTLTDQDVEPIIQKLILKFESELKAIIRK